MEVALRTRLLADSGVSALVSQISWLTRPQGAALPGITMQKIVSDRGYTMAGPGGFHGELVQFDIWASSFLAALAIRDAVIAAMESTATASGVTFSPSFLRSERQTAEDVPGVGTVSRISLDFTVWWKSNP